MTKMKQDLDAIEQELENEESFVVFFTKGSDAVDLVLAPSLTILLVSHTRAMMFLVQKPRRAPHSTVSSICF